METGPLDSLFERCFQGKATPEEERRFWEIVQERVRGLVMRKYPTEYYQGIEFEDLAAEALERVFTRGHVEIAGSPSPGRLLVSLLKTVVHQILIDRRRSEEEYKLFKILVKILSDAPFVRSARGPAGSGAADMFTHEKWRETPPEHPGDLRLEEISLETASRSPLRRGEYLPDRRDLTVWLSDLFLTFGPLHLAVRDVIHILKWCMPLARLKIVSADAPGAEGGRSPETDPAALPDMDVESKLMAEQIAKNLTPTERAVLALRSAGVGLAEIARRAGWSSPTSAQNVLTHIAISVRAAHPPNSSLGEIEQVIGRLARICTVELENTGKYPFETNR